MLRSQNDPISPGIYEALEKDWTGLFIGNAFYAVDVFFYIGGFFMAYTLMQGSKMKYLNSFTNSIKVIFLR